MIKIILDFIKKTSFITLISGTIIISFIFWNRLIRTRFPKTVVEMQDNIYFKKMIYLNVIIIIIIILVAIGGLIIKDSEKDQTILKTIKHIPGIMQILALLIWLNKHILESPKMVYELLFRLFDIEKLLKKPFYLVSNLFERIYEEKSKYIFLLTHIIFNTSPKVIVVMTFFTEVCFFDQLLYFYKILFIMLIPLTYNILLYILNDLSDKKIYYSTAHLKITSNETEDIIRFKDKVPPIENAIDFIARKKDVDLLQWFALMYETYRDVKWLVYHLVETKKKYAPYELIIISSIYLTGWLKILLYIS